MAAWKLEKLRNIGFVAHIDAGKTTVTEHFLFYSNRKHRLGSVDLGSSETDYSQIERERGITIIDAAVTCYWRDHQINIIDTPGHVDFTIEVERALRVLDGIVVIFSAVEGVEPQSETVWHQADRYNVPRIAFINKLDRIGSDYFRVVRQMKERLNANPLLLQLPIGVEDEFKGVKDLVRRKMYIWSDDESESVFGRIYQIEDLDLEADEEAAKAYEDMVTILSDYDESILDDFFENGFVDPAKLNTAIRKGTIERKFVPVLMGAALRHKGIQPLMEAVVDYLPSPIDLPPIEGINPRTGAVEKRHPSVNEPFTGLVFKIQLDDRGGQLFFVRIYSGKLRHGQKILNAVTGKKERINNLYRLHAKKKEYLEEAYAGDIIGVAGLSSTVETGHTLSDIDHPIVLKGITVPEPVVSVAIEPRRISERDDLIKILNKLSLEDPSLKVKEDEDTGQIIVSGMGELYLEVLIERLRRGFNKEVRASKPQVTFRETITREAEGVGDVTKVIGGTTHKGFVKLKVYPNERGTGNKVVVPNEIETALGPDRYEALKLGIMEVFSGGPIMSYPVVDVVVEVLEAAYGTEITPIGTRMASYEAARNAFEKAEPVLLEPYVEVDVYVPPDAVGSIINDLENRNGKLESIENISERVQLVRFRAPLRKMFGYSSAVQSLTQGHVSYQMRVAFFAPVPADDVKEIFGFI